jgi:hypothetical protein
VDQKTLFLYNRLTGRDGMSDFDVPVPLLHRWHRWSSKAYTERLVGPLSLSQALIVGAEVRNFGKDSTVEKERGVGINT